MSRSLLCIVPDFSLDRHEHLYTNIEDRLLRGDLLPNNQKALRCIVGASSIILSTLSMVSNSTLDQNGMFDLVPPTTLVVDEASQINVFEYMASDNLSHKRNHKLTISYRSMCSSSSGM